MFRFICELCRQHDSERKKSKDQLRSLLDDAGSGAVAFIADINPRRVSEAQPELVDSFIDSIFENKKWERIGFSEKLWKKRSGDLAFFNLWDLNVHTIIPQVLILSNVSDEQQTHGLNVD